MKRIYLFLSFIFLCSSLFAQTPDTTGVQNPWRLSGMTGFNLAQTSLTNWSGGGDNSVAENAFLNANLRYRENGWLWTNILILEYGLSYTRSAGTQKTSDRIDFSTQIGYSTNDKWFYSALADFKSQFSKGFNYPNKDVYVSRFMAPGYSNLSAGIGYKPNDYFSAYYSPTAMKFTFVTDDSLSNEGAFGVRPGKKVRAEFGSYLKARVEKELMENVNLMSDVNFFTAYDKSFGNIDVEWNMLLSMKINKFMNASLSTTLLYDDDIKFVTRDGVRKGPRVQFREILGIGFGYNF